MTDKNFLSIIEEGFDPSEMHPAEIEQLLHSSYEEYQGLNPGTRTRKQFRGAYNKLVDLLAQQRGFKQFSHL